MKCLQPYHICFLMVCATQLLAQNEFLWHKYSNKQIDAKGYYYKDYDQLKHFE